MNEGALHELPGRWVWTTIGDIGEVVTGTTPSKSRLEFYGKDFPFFKPTDLNEGYYVTKAGDGLSKKGIKIARLLPPKSILVTCIGATIGKTGFIRLEGASNQQINAIITEKYVFPEFIYFISISPYFQKSIIDNASATTLPILNKSKFEILKIPLPPLSEQRAIVSKIEQLFSDLDSGINNFKKAQTQLKLYRQSVLKAACEGKLVTTEAELARTQGHDYEAADVLLARILKERREKWNGKGKYKEPVAPDISGLQELPEGWCWATYEQIGKWFGGGTPSTTNSSYWNNGTIPWISPKDMKSIKINDSEDKITEIAIENSSANLIPTGSILFVVRSGILRRTLPVAITMVDATVNQDIKSLTPHASIDADYLLVTALAFNEDIRYSCAKDGTTVESIEVPTLQIYTIPLPPLAEQRRIVAEVERRLSISDKMEATITESLQKAESLHQSILKKAFEGKLLNEKELEEARNTPDWEPAEKLLERIKAEKKNIKTRNKGEK